MLFFYNLGILIYPLLLRVLAISGHQKAKLFINGRKNWQKKIENDLEDEKRKRVWFHVSSLGEFEQTKSLIDYFYDNTEYSVILTFFSPSGFEIRKEYKKADYIYYLPIDTRSNAKHWIRLAKPSLTIFTKYDYWYHYININHQRKIPLIIHSTIFQPRQVFFKWYGSLHRKMLKNFDRIFVQDAKSIDLLKTINVDQVTLAGDMRIDRVLEIKNEEWKDEKIESFKGKNKLLIVGSAWRDDWEIIKSYLNSIETDIKILIAPHNIDNANIYEIKKTFYKYSICSYSAYNFTQNNKILILDTMGMLSKVYRYGDFAFIGGGFNKSGIHNILEPAVYGLPIWIGPNYQKFIEANILTKLGGVISISNAQEFITSFVEDDHIEKMKQTNINFIKDNQGAIITIINYLKFEKYLSTTP